MKDYVLRAQKKYIKNNYTNFSFRIRNDEKEIINYLKELSRNKDLKPYIYKLVMEDMEKKGLL
mgnify:CR=1 FL=1|jgi:hypothetical protein